MLYKVIFEKYVDKDGGSLFDQFDTIRLFKYVATRIWIGFQFFIQLLHKRIRRSLEKIKKSLFNILKMLH